MYVTLAAFARHGDELRFQELLGELSRHEKDLEERINYKEEHLLNLIIEAGRGGNTSIIKILLDEGAQLDPKSVFFEFLTTPLGAAASGGKLEAMEFMLERGALLDPPLASVLMNTRPKYNPLMMAAWNGELAAVRLLVQRGAGLGATSWDGTTALAIAAKENHEDVVRFLLDSGANPDQRMAGRTPESTGPLEPLGETALMQAARAGALESVKALLEKGADLRLTDWNGDDAPVIAQLAGHWMVADFLRKALGGDLYH